MDGSADLQIASFTAQQREFRNVRVRCGGFTLSSVQVACSKGRLDSMPDAALDFSYVFDSQKLQLALTAPGGESWQVAGQLGERAWQVTAQLHNAQNKRLASLLPADVPLPTQGTLNGAVRVDGNARGSEIINVDMQLADVAFSDASGLHAAEKLRGSVRFAARRRGTEWNWQGNIAWQSGEMFWQPLYLRGGSCDTLLAQPADCGSNCQAAPDETTSHSTKSPQNSNQVAGYLAPAGSAVPCRGGAVLSASGSYDGHILNIKQAVADLPELGRVQLTVGWDVQKSTLLEGALQGGGLALTKLFETYAKPFLDKGALAESALYGHADVDAHYRNGALQSLKLKLHEAGISDAARRFALLGVNSDIDWQADAPRTATIAFAGGALLGATLGAGQWTVNMKGLEFDVPQATLPILDGKLDLRDFHLHREMGQAGKPCNGCSQAGQAGLPCSDCKPEWHWYFAGSVLPISMEQFSQAAGWPKMLGTLAGHIPRVSYDGREISVDGALLFNVFDGTVVATKLKLADAFGRAPRLSGNLAMRNLDLDLLTRTFAFGNMQGRLDADVNNLELQDWQPVRFEARLYSSAGRYPKKISQKAVQNISSLGGAGAAAAIQRSYLGIFENFGYDRIGWSCVLRNDVCQMGGIEATDNGPYSIIRGGGIPAISVMGYNRAVSWGELITRLKRVTQDNVTPIVE